MCSFPRSKAVVKKKKHQSTIICLGPHDQSKKITIIWLILCIGFRHDQFIHYVALENHTVWQRSLLIIDVLIGTCVLLDHPWWAWIILSWGCEKLMVHASSYRTWFVKFGILVCPETSGPDWSHDHLISVRDSSWSHPVLFVVHPTKPGESFENTAQLWRLKPAWQRSVSKKHNKRHPSRKLKNQLVDNYSSFIFGSSI